MLENLGEYFVVFVREDGYDKLLRCLGDSLQEWLLNINNLTVHLKHTLPPDKYSDKYDAPLIWYGI